MPMVAFASDLLAEVARRKRGCLDQLCVDLVRGVLEATVASAEGPARVQIQGAEFETAVRPASTSLIHWAERQFRA